MATGDLLDLAEWAARSARFATDDDDDMTLAKAAVNDAYLSTCGTGDPWQFLLQEGTWVTTAGGDVYDFESIGTAMDITGGTIAEILSIASDTTGRPLDSMGWEALEKYSYSTQDDANSEPVFWSKWATRIRLWPTPDQEYNLGTFCRVIPAEMTNDTDEPLIPIEWRRRLLVPYAAATLLRTEGGLETASEADRLMNRYDQDFMAFRAAYGTARRPTFRVTSPGWDSSDRYPTDRVFGNWF